MASRKFVIHVALIALAGACQGSSNGLTDQGTDSSGDPDTSPGAVSSGPADTGTGQTEDAETGADNSSGGETGPGSSECDPTDDDPITPGPMAHFDLPANTWMYTDPAPSLRYIPIPQSPDAEQERVESKEPSFREFSGVVYGEGQLFYFGGGHSGYPGNDVEIYDIANNLWTQMYKPEVPPEDDPVYGGGGSPNLSPTGKSYTIHGYARTSYDPVSHRYICTTASSVAAYDAACNQWEMLSGQHAPAPGPLPAWGNGDQISMWDPALGGLLFSGMYDWYGYWLWAGGEFEFYGDPGQALSASGGAASVYAAPHAVHIVAVLRSGADGPAENTLFRYQPAPKPGQAQPIDLPPELTELLDADGNLVMAYDSLHDRLVVLAGGEDGRPRTWAYDIATDQWEMSCADDSAPILSEQFTAGTGRSIFNYDPVSNLFFLVFPKGGGWDLGVETWAYRYAE
jgi:hypothetical protein